MNLATEIENTEALNRYELLFKGLEQTEELHYFRFLAKKFKFHVSNDWKKTIQVIHQDLTNPSSIKPDVTFPNLELLIDQIIISADKAYKIYNVEGKVHEALMSLSGNVGQDDLKDDLLKIYPSKIIPESLHPQGTYLTVVKQFDSGLAFVFSTLKKSSEFNSETGIVTKYLTHFYNIVFVPKNSNRIEVRVCSKTPKNDIDDSFRQTINVFYDYVGSKGIDLRNAKEISFYKCIESFYLDKNAGRAASVVMSTDEQSSDATLSNKKVRDYCARTQLVHDNSGNNHSYKCRAVNIRWPLLEEKQCEMQVTIEPHKNLWEREICNHISVKHPESLLRLNRLISDVISRA
jgi:hypothetical protein